ncbi:MAG: hypothetical protein WBC70_01760 [Candidatus Aminicenantales bacterium]
MKNFGIKLWLPILSLLVISGFAPGVPADGTFTLEQVLKIRDSFFCCIG